MTRPKLFLLLICLLSWTGWMPRAQDRGQICVQAFLDSDADGAHAADEALISQGIGASLLDSNSITIASQLLEDSPYGADGLLCFDDLLAGEYLVLLTSAEYAATTATSFRAAVSPGSPPFRFDLGLKALFAGEAGTGSRGGQPALDEATVRGLLLALLASAITACIMTLLGLLIYFFIIRRRHVKTRAWQQS